MVAIFYQTEQIDERHLKVYFFYQWPFDIVNNFIRSHILPAESILAIEPYTDLHRPINQCWLVTYDALLLRTLKTCMILDAPKPFPALSLAKIMQTTKLLPADTVTTARVKCFCGQWECPQYQEHTKVVQDYNMQAKDFFAFQGYNFYMREGEDDFIEAEAICYECDKWLCHFNKQVLYLYVNRLEKYLTFFCSHACFRKWFRRKISVHAEPPLGFEKHEGNVDVLFSTIQQDMLAALDHYRFLFAFRASGHTQTLFHNIIERCRVSCN